MMFADHDKPVLLIRCDERIDLSQQNAGQVGELLDPERAGHVGKAPLGPMSYFRSKSPCPLCRFSWSRTYFRI